MSFVSLRTSTLASLGVLLALAAACTDSSPTEPSGFAPFAQTDVRIGTGAAAANGDELVVNYTGWFYDATKQDQKGLQFESSAGRQPLQFTLGAAEVIAGWDRGIVGMRAGGLRRLVIPPSLSYGPTRNGAIPGHATLIFEVELVSVTRPSGS